MGAIIHGHCTTKADRLYTIWRSMKQRCYDKNRKDYHSYGGRGITICDEWRNDFRIFADWALKNGYSEKLSLDRIDNDGNYCPENCRWATRREQDHNRPEVVLYYYKGDEYTINELGGAFKVNPDTIKRRLDRGYDLEYAIEDSIKHTRVPWDLQKERDLRNKRRKMQRMKKLCN